MSRYRTVSLVKPTGTCTCCPIPQPMTHTARGWRHNADGTPAHVFHVHESTEQRDCDGVYTKVQTHQLTSWRPDSGWITSADGLWRFMIYLTIGSLDGGENVKITLNGSDRELHVSQDTDEGYAVTELSGCDNAGCAYDSTLSRDHSAEAAGY
jgi:hypothetical protein